MIRTKTETVLNFALFPVSFEKGQPLLEIPLRYEKKKTPLVYHLLDV